MGWKENKKGGESRDNLKKKEEILQPPKLEVNASKKGEERKERMPRGAPDGIMENSGSSSSSSSSSSCFCFFFSSSWRCG